MKDVETIGPPLFSNATNSLTQTSAEEKGKGEGGERRNVLLSRVFDSLSQKLIVPSEPAVENVPYGWNEMSFTANTVDDFDGAGSSFL